MMIKQIQKGNGLTIKRSLFFTSLIKAASFLKMSFIVGSGTAFFSAISVVVPLIGVFTTISGSLFLCGLSLLVRYVLSGSVPFIFLAYHIPGFCASLYFASYSLGIRVVLPLICMGAFIAHPVGEQAWMYSLYWLIPVAVHALGKKSLFLQALGSTFTAHAVGSVIWIYANPMTPQAWLFLMPVVLVERLVFASAMVVVYHVIRVSQTFRQKFFTTTLRRYLVAE